jgi:hypothetical protein
VHQSVPLLTGGCQVGVDGLAFLFDSSIQVDKYLFVGPSDLALLAAIASDTFNWTMMLRGRRARRDSAEPFPLTAIPR